MAAVSHVTHLLSYALHGVASGMGRELVDLVAGPSFRDATRVAASDPAFWADVTGRNRAAIQEVLGEVQAWLDAATTEDAPTLADRLAGARRRPLGSAEGDPMTVALDDLPGALAELRRLGMQGCAVTGLDRDGARVSLTRR